MEKLSIKKENSFEDCRHLNLTEGGDGGPKSLETRRKISLSKEGKKNPNHSKKMKGRKLSEEHRKKLSLNHKFIRGSDHVSSKSIKCLDTNKIFGSIREAAKLFGGNHQILSRHLNKKYGYPFFKGFKFEFIGELNEF